MVPAGRAFRRVYARRPRRRHPARVLRSMLAAVALLLVVAGGIVTTLEEATGAPSGHAAEDALPSGFAPYVYRTTGEQADPINLIFRTDDGARVAEAVQRVLGWRPVDAAPMTFHDAATRSTGWQFQLPLGPRSRFHMRVEAVTPADGRTYVLAAVHRDDSASCGHIGTAFDDARELVTRAFAGAGYGVSLETLGNTAPGRQCDGSATAGDGRAAVIDLQRP